MAQNYEVLVGALNLRTAPGGSILMKLTRPARLEEIGPSVVDASNVTWLAVKVMPAGFPTGFVCEQYVGRVDALGRQASPASPSQPSQPARPTPAAPSSPSASGLQVTEAQLKML